MLYIYCAYIYIYTHTHTHLHGGSGLQVEVCAGRDFFFFCERSSGMQRELACVRERERETCIHSSTLNLSHTHTYIHQTRKCRKGGVGLEDEPSCARRALSVACNRCVATPKFETRIRRCFVYTWIFVESYCWYVWIGARAAPAHIRTHTQYMYKHKNSHTHTHDVYVHTCVCKCIYR